jgi:hypothetical protein
MKDWEVTNGRCVEPCTDAIRLGFCRQCYAARPDPPRVWLKVEQECLVCHRTFRGRKWDRYCPTHVPLRHELQTPAITWPRVEPVRFSPPDPEDLLSQATSSIRILRPDGTLDVERTELERGQWLTRQLRGPWEAIAVSAMD